MTIPCLSFQKLKPINLQGFTSGFQSIWFQVVPFFEAIVAAKNFKSCREIENLCLCLQKRFPKYEERQWQGHAKFNKTYIKYVT